MRLGAFATAAAGLVPAALASLPPELTVTLREGTTPALTRALRAGTLDLAILAQMPPFRPPDAESPALELTTLSERELVVGVPATTRSRRARGRGGAARGPGLGREPVRRGRLLLGVWPGLAERPDVRYVVRDWLAKLQIVAAGPGDHHARPGRARVPPGVAVVAVRGEPQETRRLVLARRPGRSTALPPAWPMR